LFFVTAGIDFAGPESPLYGVTFVSPANEANRFANIVEPHLADALMLARWLTGNATDAEDIVQEACLRAFRSIGSFNGGSARAWVLAIVRNTAFTWLAKNRKFRLVAFEDLSSDDRERLESGAGSESGAIATPEQQLIMRADASCLAAAIANLPEEFREVLVLRDLQGLDYREIATVTAAPLGTVMSRLARARQRLIRAVAAPQEK
jgi:RNA polymerase sigma-70 factor (ECF subfamily)